MGHTPGPWRVIWHGNEKYPYPLSVHTADGAYWITRDGTVSSVANAKLIAAAPDMLAALKALLNDPGPEKLLSKHWDMARAAIERAE